MQELNQAREGAQHPADSGTPVAERDKADLAESEALGGRVQAAAADLTQCEAAFLTLLGEFDAAAASRWWDGIGSTAQWLAWACSIAPVTAREHVRVARALRTLPVIAEAFGRGELSYSKVRTLTRMTGRYQQEKLLQLARAATAAQLARTVSAYRAVSGTHAQRERRTKVSWSNRPDGLVQIRAVLLPEDGAAVVAALEEATDQNREDAKSTCPGTEIIPPDGDAETADDDRDTDAAEVDGDLTQARSEVARDEAESREDTARRSRVSALVGVFQHWLESRPEDRSGADHTTVVIEVDAAELANGRATSDIEAASVAGAAAGPGAHELIAGSFAEVEVPGASAEASPTPIVPATAVTGTDESNSEIVSTGASAEALPRAAVPKESQQAPTTSTPTDGTCHVRGHAGIEPDTARRLACEAKVHAIIHGLNGEPLAVSRSQRFGTRAQRRALMKRDEHCQFPGCARQRNLKIHHIDHWIDGGTTDLTNLMLLCQLHHTSVHEGHLTISPSTGPIRWRFHRPDGSVIVPEVVGLRYEQALPLLCDDFGVVLPDGPARDALLERRRLIIEENRRHRERVQSQQATLLAAYDDIESSNDPRARRSFPIGGGAGFILGNCVEVLFNCELPGAADDQQESLGLAA